MSLTLGQLLDQLTDFAIRAEGARDLPVRLNGEYLQDLRLTVQNPIAEVRRNNSMGIRERKHDPARERVIDIDANGREPQPLPIFEYDLRRW